MRKLDDNDERATWGIKPRNCLDLQTTAEAAIRAAVHEVEIMGAHTMLTETVVLLGQALTRLGEYIDDVESRAQNANGASRPVRSARPITFPYT